MNLELIEDRKKTNKKLFVALNNFNETMREMNETMRLWKQQLDVIENVLNSIKGKL